MSDCCQKIKHRSDKEYKSLINRLNRIEGQVRGVKNMLENDAYCTDILTQVSAVNAALNAFNKELLSNHIHSCVVDDIKNILRDSDYNYFLGFYSRYTTQELLDKAKAIKGDFSLTEKQKRAYGLE